MASLVDASLTNPQLKRNRSSYTLQSLFNATAVVPSCDLGLINSPKIILSGDGSSLHIHANGSRHNVIQEENALLSNRFSSTEANFGWDCDLRAFYFYFILSNFTNHNSNPGISLPYFISTK